MTNKPNVHVDNSSMADIGLVIRYWRRWRVSNTSVGGVYNTVITCDQCTSSQLNALCAVTRNRDI